MASNCLISTERRSYSETKIYRRSSSSPPTAEKKGAEGRRYNHGHGPCKGRYGLPRTCRREETATHWPAASQAFSLPVPPESALAGGACFWPRQFYLLAIASTLLAIFGAGTTPMYGHSGKSKKAECRHIDFKRATSAGTVRSEERRVG